MSGQGLCLGRVALTDDERIANVRSTLEGEAGTAADIARWALDNWALARAALVGVREAVEDGDVEDTIAGLSDQDDEVLTIVAEGLEVIETETIQ